MPVNAVLLVACILIALGSVIYFFFWNRIFAFALSLLVRLALWTRNSSAVWVGLGSIHLSLISGRIMIRDLRYHSSNQTFRIVKCELSWRWWIRNAAEEEDLSDAAPDEGENTSRQKHAPKCRIHIAVEGFEWFMYNRTASFDNILSQLAATDPALAQFQSKGYDSNDQSNDPSALNRHRSRNTLYSTGRQALSSVRLPTFVQSRLEKMKHQLPDLNPKNLLPLSFEATKGAITMGNHTVKNLFMAEFVYVSGTFGLVQSRSKFDQCKQLLRMSFNEVAISCIENPDYWETGLNLGKDIRETAKKAESIFDRIPLPLSFKEFSSSWARARSQFPYFKSRGRRYKKVEKNKEQKWTNWGRKKNDEINHIGADFSKLEYAIDRRLLEAPVMDLVYHADVAGEVPNRTSASAPFDERQKGLVTEGLEFLDIGNCDLPPEWTVEVVVQGGSIRYGPWADRQRAQIQRVFFPQSFFNGTPTKRLEPGDARSCTCLKLLFEFRDETTLTLPFKEASKDWQWDGYINVPRDTKQREAEYLQVRIGDKSFVKYLVPMVALGDSYNAELSVFIDAISISSSLNDIRLLEAKFCKIGSELPSPLQWDRHRTWIFNVDLSQPVLNLIRDHINMLTDLGKDWSSGPPTGFDTFIPITYGVHLSFSDYELNLYANDHNVIDRPLEKRENASVCLKADSLLSAIHIPSDKFRPLSTAVSFHIETPNMDVIISLPRWNTHALSLASVKHVSNIGHISAFKLEGSYIYHAEVREDCIDQLTLHVKIPSPALKVYGWLIRHVMVLRENYFGTFTQYSTTREYLSKYDRGVPVGDPLDLKYRPGKSNVFHLTLTLLVENCHIALPAGLIGYEKERAMESDIDMGSCALLDVPDLQLSLRLHDYSMEMSLNVDPIWISVEGSCVDSQLFSHRMSLQKPRLSIAGLDITANRLFGPQPHTSTYVCAWNIHAGRVKGFLYTHEGQILALVLRSFLHSFNDPFNAPAEEFQQSPVRDATFLKMVIEGVDVVWQPTAASIRLFLPDGLRFSFNNVANVNYRKVTSVSVPIMDAQMLLPPTTGKQWLEVCRFRTRICLDMYKAPEGWRMDAKAQRDFLAAQDQPTQRFTNMGGSVNRSARHKNLLYLSSVSAPRLQFPGGRKYSSGLSGKPVVGIIHEDLLESESDAEQFVSEFDRDQKLANSRPASFAYPKDKIEDDSTSFMDESDEAGSDSEDNRSVYSGFGDGSSKMNIRAPYWSLCRRFRLFRASSVFTFESTFASDAKEVSIGHDFKIIDEDTASIDGDKNEHSPPWNGVYQPDDIDRTCLRLNLSETLIFVTSLALECISELMSERRKSPMSPELQLDMLTFDWMSSAPSGHQKPSVTTLQLMLNSQQISIVQDVSSTTYSAEEAGRGSIIFSQVLVKSAELIANLPSADDKLSSKQPQPCAQICIDEINASTRFLSAPLTSKKGRTDANEKVAVELRCDSLSSILTPSKVDFSIGGSFLQLHDDSTETLLRLTVSLVRPISKMLDAWKKSKRVAKSSRQHLLQSLLKIAGSEINKDLLSSVQPAFFVQRGRPRQLRQDRSWKLLFHLRHSLPDVDNLVYSQLEDSLHNFPSDPAPGKPEKTEDSLHILDELRVDTSIGILGKMFEIQTEETHDESQNVNKARLKSVAFHIDMMKVLWGDASPGSMSIIDSLHLRGDLLSRSLLNEPQVASSYASSAKLARTVAEHNTCHIGLHMSIQSVQVTVFPTIFAFLQNAIHVWRTVPLSSASSEKVSTDEIGALSSSDSSEGNKVVACTTHIVVHHALIEAAAENVVFGIATEEFCSFGVCHIPTSAAVHNNRTISGSQTTRYDDLIIRVRARSVSDASHDDKDTLAEANIAKNTFSVLYQHTALQGTSVRSTICADTVEFNFPRSALRLYHFFEQWREDYLPGIETTVRSVFLEIRQNPKSSKSTTHTKERQTLLLGLNISVSNVAVVMQVMHGTWLVWTAHSIIAYLKSRLREKNSNRVAGVQINSQTIKIMSSSPSQKASQITNHLPKIALGLPSLSACITSTPKLNDLLITFGFLQVTIKPSHWDSLLSIQQKFGQDFNDLLLIISNTRHTHQTGKPAKPKGKPVAFRIEGRFDGFKIGLEGPSSTQLLECTDINAAFKTSGPLQYQFTLNGLSLYLTPKTMAKKTLSPDKSQLPVMVSVDLQVSGHRGAASKRQHALVILNITKFHAVLQAHLIGDVGDFVDHLQAEVLLRKEQRALELDEFKAKARKVMSTFNMNSKTSNLGNDSSFIRNQSFAVSVTNLGLAFPLSHNKKHLTRSWTDGNSVTQAFLITVASLEFEAQRGETGEARVKDFCAQFVARFNPSDGRDFSAKRHHTPNQLIYPQMTAKLNSRSTSSSRQISISTSISGFVLDLDPSVTGYTFSLVDAYRQGKQRMEQLASVLPKSAPDQDPLTPVTDLRLEHDNAYARRVTTALELSMNFQSGTVRMHSRSRDSSSTTSEHTDWRHRPYRSVESDAEMFFLPELTLWCEYRAERSGSKSDSPVLLFKSTVHSSSNTLRPSLLPFITGIVHNIEERMKRISHTTEYQRSSIMHRSLSTVSGDEVSADNNRTSQPVSALQIIFSLRIDKSRIEFTCKPDVNVVAGLNWESGGFVFNMCPGARGASISASISGLTASLKHGFLSENSAYVDARNLNASVNFAKTSLGQGLFINSVSVVVDTEFSGSFRFSRLQDFLCLKAVWLDHVPVYKRDVAERTASPSTLSPMSPAEQPAKQGFDTAILLRVRRITFEADLGQSISIISLTLQSALIRTRLTSELSEIALMIASVEVIAQGNLSGSLRMPDFFFRTVRRRQRLYYEQQPRKRMLELNLTTGPLDIQLQSDWLWLLQYRAEPLEAVVHDDWTEMQGSENQDRELQLFFSVTGTKVIAMMTIMALPKLVMYAGKLGASLEEQREGASRESSAFRSTRLPKPDNALSEVANAMLKSARGKLKESDNLSYTISQHMKLELEELVFIVLPRSQNDNELARFVGRNVSAQLERVVRRSTYPIHRLLELSLSRMAISQLLRHHLHSRVQESDVLAAVETKFSGTENIIFSLPSMNMRMTSDEDYRDGLRMLPYDFDSTFVRRDGQMSMENINITFNISLYSWLTVLRKTFTRELKRAQDIAEWRAGNVSSALSGRPRQGSTDLTTSPINTDNDRDQTPPRSRSSSRSRPPSPLRSRSVESVIISQLSQSGRSFIPRSPGMQTNHATSDAGGASGDPARGTPSFTRTPSTVEGGGGKVNVVEAPPKKSLDLVFQPRSRKIERLTVRQLGEATPDVMHPFFTKKAGFNLEESLPQYVHEYATVPIEEIMKVLLRLYGKQLS